MKVSETLRDKANRLWQAAGLPEYLNKFGPHRTCAWEVFACHLEYTAHVPSWRRASSFMFNYHGTSRHWTSWQKALAKWGSWVWDALAVASAQETVCEVAATDGTTFARSNPSKHYEKRIDRDTRVSRPVQVVVMVDVRRRKFLSWRVRSTPRGEKCDVQYLLKHSPCEVETNLLDKGFDAEWLHQMHEDFGICSIAPARARCKKGWHRKKFRDYFDYGLYWQRNIVECLFSAIKRLFGVHVRARTWRAQRAELAMRFIAYNIGAIKTKDFLQSLTNP